jgi:hypothetical protein
MTSTHTRNIAGITAFAQEQRQRTKRKVDEATGALVIGLLSNLK